MRDCRTQWLEIDRQRKEDHLVFEDCGRATGSPIVKLHHQKINSVDGIPTVTPNSSPLENNAPIDELLHVLKLGNVNRGNVLVWWLLLK